MALTLGFQVLPTRSYVSGDRIEVLIDAIADSSYPTGGYSLTPSQLGLTTELDFINGTVVAAPSSTVTSVSYDVTNQKLKFLAGGSEVANTTNLATVVVRLVAKGKGFNAFNPF